VALRRLRAVQEYVSLMVEMEQRLLQARIGAARARTLVGHSYASLTGVDDVEEMSAVVRVDVSPAAVFGLVKEDEEKEEEEKSEGVRKRKGKEAKGDAKKEEDSDDEEEEAMPKKKSSPPPPAFRPYGILEPGCAKEARKAARAAAELAITAATVRARIIDCDRATTKLLASLEKPELDTIFKLLAV
ncbi:hypothetical protein PRIPAC_84279, partial [Pristionchus pacificus]